MAETKIPIIQLRNAHLFRQSRSGGGRGGSLESKYRSGPRLEIETIFTNGKIRASFIGKFWPFDLEPETGTWDWIGKNGSDRLLENHRWSYGCGINSKITCTIEQRIFDWKKDIKI